MGLFKRNLFFSSCFTLFLSGAFFVQSLNAQDILYARKVIDTLSSPGMEGRGYVNRGDRKAAGFLASEYKRLGVSPFDDDYFQEYHFPMNTLPGKLELSVNGIPLDPGSQFQVWAASPAMAGNFKVKVLKGKDIMDEKRFRRFMKKDLTNKFLLIDKKGIEDKKALARIDSLKFTNYPGTKGMIFVSDQKLSWSVMIGYQPRNYSVIDILREALPEKPSTLSLTVESRFFREYRTQNVIGFLKGAVQPDTFLVFTAHYDHLGRMGSEVYYPGANDNASGTAMVLDLARHYKQPGNQPYYSIVFICLSGEEAGLHGSTYCADNPPVDLRKVKFLVNLDMVGTGSEGITMVNATVYKDAYQKMVKLNADHEYLLTVKERGESCNSDHCPFYKKGVPAVFIYSMGKEFGEYHNQDDISSKLPLSEYNDIFRLLVDFMNSMKPD